MSKTVRALALAALFLLGGTATAHATTATTAGSAGQTVAAATTMPGPLCMAC